MQRRHVLQALLAAGTLPMQQVLRAQSTPITPNFSRDPFQLGVASGYPSHHSVVLWTRLAPQPQLADGGVDPLPIAVQWQVARDEAMRDVVASGTHIADAQWAHSVHVEVTGLAPARWYWYRFRVGDAFSAIGRTRTAPAPQTLVDRVHFAFASCQQYEQGWFSAHAHIANDAPDFVAFLGDYIYESSWGRAHVRKHNAGEPYTLADYRQRYALYKSDPDLQRAHAACPWVLTWDDHEVDNDYANDRPEDGMPRDAFLLRRAAAYKAFYEHQPLPARMRPIGADLPLHTQWQWGALLQLHLLDGRQYRSAQVCPTRAGGSAIIDVESCAALNDPSLTMLGQAQEQWLHHSLGQTKAHWNVLAQATLMAPLDRRNRQGAARIWTDGWDGYPAARQRLLQTLATQRVRNPVVIGGDVHLFWVADLHAQPDQAQSPVIASEFVCTSITSQGPTQASVDTLLKQNPHLKYGHSEHRGYVRVELTAQQWRADLRALENEKTPNSNCQTLARFVVESDRPGAQRVS